MKNRTLIADGVTDNTEAFRQGVKEYGQAFFLFLAAGNYIVKNTIHLPDHTTDGPWIKDCRFEGNTVFQVRRIEDIDNNCQS